MPIGFREPCSSKRDTCHFEWFMKDFETRCCQVPATRCMSKYDRWIESQIVSSRLKFSNRESRVGQTLWYKETPGVGRSFWDGGSTIFLSLKNWV